MFIERFMKKISKIRVESFSNELLRTIDSYSRLTDGIEAALDMADKAAEEDDRRYTHEEVFSNLRSRVNG